MKRERHRYVSEHGYNVCDKCARPKNEHIKSKKRTNRFTYFTVTWGIPFQNYFREHTIVVANSHLGEEVGQTHIKGVKNAERYAIKMAKENNGQVRRTVVTDFVDFSKRVKK